MQSSDVSAYLNLQQATDVGVPKRPEAGANAASIGTSAAAARFDTTSVSASARALTFQRQSEIAAQALPIERLSRLRDEKPNFDRIAHAILQTELEQ